MTEAVEKEPAPKAEKVNASPDEGASNEAKRFLDNMAASSDQARRDLGSVAYDERVIKEIQRQAEGNKKLQEVKVERGPDGTTTISWKSGNKEHSISAKGRDHGARNKDLDLTDGLQGIKKLTKEQNDRVDLLTKDKSKMNKEERAKVDAWMKENGKEKLKDLSTEDMLKALHPNVTDKDIRDAKAYQSVYEQHLKDHGSVPVRRGEGYHDVAKRMNPKQGGESEKDYDSRIKKLTKDLKEWNGKRSSLVEGEQLRTWPPEQDEARLGPDLRAKIAEQDFEADKAKDASKAKVPSAAELAGLTKEEAEAFTKKQSYTEADFNKEKGRAEGQKLSPAEKGEYFTKKDEHKKNNDLASFLQKEKGMPPEKAKARAEQAQAKQDELAKAKLDQIRQNKAEAAVPAEAAERPAAVEAKKKEIAESEEKSAAEAQEKEKRKFLENPLGEVPRIGALAGIPEETAKEIVEKQNQGDTRKFGEIAKAWGFKADFDQLEATQKELKQFKSQVEEFAKRDPQNRQARRDDAVEKFKKDPSKELPPLSKLVGMLPGKVADEFDNQTKNRSPEEQKKIAERFGLPAAEFDKAREAFDSASKLQSQSRVFASKGDEHKEAVRKEAEKEFAKNPSEELPPLSKLAGMGQDTADLAREFDKRAAGKSGEELDRLAKSYGINDIDKALKARDSLSELKQQAGDFAALAPAKRKESGQKAEDEYRSSLAANPDSEPPSLAKLAGMSGRLAEEFDKQAKDKNPDQLTDLAKSYGLPEGELASALKIQESLKGMKAAADAFRDELKANPEDAKLPSPAKLAGLSDAEIEQNKDEIVRLGLDGYLKEKYKGQGTGADVAAAETRAEQHAKQAFEIRDKMLDEQRKQILEKKIDAELARYAGAADSSSAPGRDEVRKQILKKEAEERREKGRQAEANYRANALNLELADIPSNQILAGANKDQMEAISRDLRKSGEKAIPNEIAKKFLGLSDSELDQGIASGTRLLATIGNAVNDFRKTNELPSLEALAGIRPVELPEIEKAIASAKEADPEADAEVLKDAAIVNALVKIESNGQALTGDLQQAAENRAKQYLQYAKEILAKMKQIKAEKETEHL